MTPIEQAKLKAQGWSFNVDHWVNGHNGDPEETYQFKTPELTEWVDLYLNSWEEASVASLRRRAKSAIVVRRLEENEDSIRDQIAKVLHRDPKAKRLTVTLKLE